MTRIETPRWQLFRMHGWILLALFVVVGDIVTTRFDAAQRPQLVEAAVLFDLVIVLPVLYGWWHRARGRVVLLRMLGLSCLGFWVASHVVPDAQHGLIERFGMLRYAGLAVLVVFELRLMLAIWRAAFSGGDRAVETIARDADMPVWAARLMAFEARLWRKAASSCARLFRRG